MKQLFIILIALVALAGGVFAQRWVHSDAVKTADTELDMTFPDLEGKLHSLSEWKGKVLIVNFWATWCPPCLQEMPEFIKLQTELGPKGLQFVGILTDDESDAAREFLKAKPLNYPVLDGSIGARQWTEKLGDRAGVLPISVIFAPDGKRVHTELGILTREEVLEQVKPWLK